MGAGAKINESLFILVIAHLAVQGKNINIAVPLVKERIESIRLDFIKQHRKNHCFFDLMKTNLYENNWEVPTLEDYKKSYGEAKKEDIDSLIQSYGLLFRRKGINTRSNFFSHDPRTQPKGPSFKKPNLLPQIRELKLQLENANIQISTLESKLSSMQRENVILNAANLILKNQLLQHGIYNLESQYNQTEFSPNSFYGLFQNSVQEMGGIEESDELTNDEYYWKNGT